MCQRNSRLLLRYVRDVILLRHTITDITLWRVAVALAAILVPYFGSRSRVGGWGEGVDFRGERAYVAKISKLLVMGNRSKVLRCGLFLWNCSTCVVMGRSQWVNDSLVLTGVM